MAKVCCSIETEPRTLSEGQLMQAIEVAAGVVQTMEPKEASELFTNGLKPITSSILEMVEHENEEEEKEERDDLVPVKGKSVAGIPCQCSTNTGTSTESPPPEGIKFKKEPLTAPF